ncbi:MAG: glycosyltransferase, partial [Catenulispora sp.]|nr:glycosyltransferase [Catenulispora sp.]
MIAVEAPDPQISVIITTYNRGDLVRRQLHHLTRQTVPAGTFEVIVSDDGSSDDTKSIVDAYADRLPLTYHFQEDLGFRACLARNTGARLARGQVLVFLDSGALPGPGFVAGHLAAHADPLVRHAVAGYGHGFG